MWSMGLWSSVMNRQGRSLTVSAVQSARKATEMGADPVAPLCRVIVEVGFGVKRLKVGDRVALEPGVPCWSNKACREGRYNLCPDIKFFATPPHHGSLMQVWLVH